MNVFQRTTALLRTQLMNQLSASASLASSLGSRSFGDLLVSLEVNELFGSNQITKRDLAIIRQIQDIDKKFTGDLGKDDSSDQSRNAACLGVFKAANLRCAFQNTNFQNLDTGMMHILETARNDIANCYERHVMTDEFEFLWCKDGSFERLVPVSGFSSGPGSCSKVMGTSLLQKYRGEWMFSDKRGIALFDVLSKISKPIHDLQTKRARIVAAISASYAPKNRDISRLIAPQLNGDIYLQYPAESCLTNMLKYMGVDITKQQSINRELARKGSLFDNFDLFEYCLARRRWRPCTIDMTSASDLIGTALCRYELPPQLFEYLDSCRASKMIDTDGSSFTLNMMGTMGNAYTFPLQTLIFCAIIRAVYFHMGLKFTQDGQYTYSVYGDDMIVDVAAYDTVVKVFEKLSMVANVKKSFSTGYFRESCGKDYYMGYDIRPVSCETLDTDCDKYSLANRLIDWGCVHSVDVSLSVRFLLSTIERKVLVPLDFGVTTGLQVPQALLTKLPYTWTSSVRTAVRLNSLNYSFLAESVEIAPTVLPVPSYLVGDLSGRRSYTSACHLPIHLARYEKHPVKVVIPVHRREFGTANRYYSYNFVSLNVKEHRQHVRLSRKERSLFCFLRGGVSQTQECIFSVPVPSKDTLKEIFLRSETVSIWDSPVLENGPVLDLGGIRAIKMRAIERVFEETVRFAPLLPNTRQQ